MEFTTTSRGKQMLIHHKHLYVFQKTLSGGVQSWECQLRRKKECKARVKIFNGECRGVNYSFDGRTGFENFWDCFGISSDSVGFFGDFFPKDVRDFS